MSAAPRLRAAGFSLLELVIVIVLISVLLVVGIERLLLMKARAEAAAMENVLGTLRSALYIRVAELIARGRSAEVAALIGSNPMSRLAERPPNYLGELFGPDPSALAPGNWYFDNRERVLCYLVDSTDYFETAVQPPWRTCFSVRPVVDEPTRGRRVESTDAGLRGIQLAAVYPYVWRMQWPGWPWSAASTDAAR